MATRSIIKLIFIAIIIIGIIIAAVARSQTTNSVKKLLRRADALEGSGDIQGAISLYKQALKMAITHGVGRSGTIFELKEMMNLNGWFLVQKLKAAYSKENIPFDFESWKDIVGQLNSKSNNASGKMYSQMLIQLYKDLP